MKRMSLLIGVLCLSALATTTAAAAGPDSDGTARAMRWWNALDAEQMVAALYGDEATAAQTAAAQKLYADLDDDTRALVNAAADEIYHFDSVGAWWESLDCRRRRIAAGDGVTADPMSPYCAHYPGSGATNVLSDEARAHVDHVGMALLDRDTPGVFGPLVGMGTHGLGTTLEYVTVNEDGTTEPNAILEYTGYGMHRGRAVLVLTYSLHTFWGTSCSTSYWDLATGNLAACLDEDGAVHAEWIPHSGYFEFPMMEGTRDSWQYGYQEDGSEFCDDVCKSAETWTVEACGIELEVVAGTFMVCRQSATASWDPDVDWTEWFDPENNLRVKTRFYGAVSELSDYNLVE